MRFLFLVLFFLASSFCWAEEIKYADIVASGTRQLKMAMEIPAASLDKSEAAREAGDVIAFDMNMSGVVVAEIREQLPVIRSITSGEVDFTPWLANGYDLLLRSEVSLKGDELAIEFRLYDVINRKLLAGKRYLGKRDDLRRLAHSFADEILLQLDKEGGRGCFTSHIAYVTTQSGNKEITFADWDGHNAHPLTRNRSINLNPVFSPDGREIIFSSYKHGNPDLYKLTLSSGSEKTISNRKNLNITGSWSPDGTRIALTLSKDGNSEIYTINKDGSAPVRLTINPAIDVSPTWSPDGSRIAFVSDRLGKPQIFIMNSDGSNVRRLTTTGSYNVNPAWSPKGDRIAYASMQNGVFQIHSIKTDGADDIQLTATGSNENPAWSPDGRFLAFSSKQNGKQAIHVMRADGGGQTKVSQGAGNCSQPSWSPR